MDSRIVLLNKFYSTDKTKAKIESKNSGTEYLDSLTINSVFEYGEFKNGIFKYKLSDLSPARFDELLSDHIATEINLCAYFNKESNNNFAFNLDYSALPTNDVKIAALLLMQNLIKLEMFPLIIKSGRGYHMWCKIDEKIENTRLISFMNKLKQISIFNIKRDGFNTENVNCTLYPRVDTNDISLRMFGSNHIDTGMFSSVVTEINKNDKLLDMSESWDYFDWYINNRIITKTCFESAYKKIML